MAQVLPTAEMRESCRRVQGRDGLRQEAGGDQCGC
jgi:hypothetical protein